MKTYNSTKYFNFYLGGRIKVVDLSTGAKLYGGATKFEDGVYSNVETDNNIKVYRNKPNRLSVIVPSTLDVNQHIDNSRYVTTYFGDLAARYDKIESFKTEGSWYSDDLCQVIVENSTILTIISSNITENDILWFKDLALKIKSDMNQEGVSIIINESLAIV